MKDKFLALKNRIGNISIKWKIFSFMAIFVAFVIGLLWIMQVVFLDDFYKYIKINEIKSSASEIKSGMKALELSKIESSELEERMTNLSSFGNTSILLIDEYRNLVYNSENRQLSPIYTSIYSQFNEIVRMVRENNNEYIQYNYFVLTPVTSRNVRDGMDGFTVQGEEPYREARSYMQDDRRMPQSILYATIGTLRDGTEVLVVLNTNITPVDATVQTIRWQLIIITIILLSVALLIALLTAIMISSPIMKINDTSKEFAKGKYDVVFKGNGYKEIKELSDTLNFAANELSKVDEYRKDLLANVSHDLRTPLTLITGYSEVMRDIPGENTQENIQTIIDEAGRLTQLVNDVIDVSRYESNAQILHPENYNLTESIGELVGRIAKMASKNGYNIEFVRDENVSVHADELKISRAVYNLLGNAITYTGESKKVIIKQEVSFVAEAERVVRISIIDFGAGIPKDNLKNIWERYYKIDKDTDHKRSHVGTGLGLSIVKSVFDLHKIRYGVMSEIDKGSVFWFEMRVV